jgi:hypothetical protein
MNRAASARMRSYLRKFQSNITSNGLVIVRLPKKLENGSVSTDTTIDIDITIGRPANDFIGHMMNFGLYLDLVSDGLHCVQFGRLRIHVIEEPYDAYPQSTRELEEYYGCSRVICRYLASGYPFYRVR